MLAEQRELRGTGASNVAWDASQPGVGDDAVVLRSGLFCVCEGDAMRRRALKELSATQPQLFDTPVPAGTPITAALANSALNPPKQAPGSGPLFFSSEGRSLEESSTRTPQAAAAPLNTALGRALIPLLRAIRDRAAEDDKGGAKS